MCLFLIMHWSFGLRCWKWRTHLVGRLCSLKGMTLGYIGVKGQRGVACFLECLACISVLRACGLLACQLLTWLFTGSEGEWYPSEVGTSDACAKQIKTHIKTAKYLPRNDAYVLFKPVMSNHLFGGIWCFNFQQATVRK